MFSGQAVDFRGDMSEFADHELQTCKCCTARAKVVDSDSGLMFAKVGSLCAEL